MKLSVIIPVYNERDTIARLVSRVLAAPFEKEVILVDDASSDGTDDQLREAARLHPEIRVFFHDRNRGKGAALRTGFSAAKGDVFLTQDGDLEYNPQEYAQLLEPILAGRTQIVYGSRFLGNSNRRFLFWHAFGNRFLTWACNLLYGLNLTDMETGYKVFTRQVLDKMTLCLNRFGFDPEFTAKAAKLRLRICEVPIGYKSRDYSAGKKIRWKDGVLILAALLRFRLLN